MATMTPGERVLAVLYRANSIIKPILIRLLEDME